MWQLKREKLAVIMRDTRRNSKLLIHKPIIYVNVLLLYFLLYLLHGDLMNIDKTIHKLQIILKKESKIQDPSYLPQISDSSSLELQRIKREIIFEGEIDSMINNVDESEVLIINGTKERRYREYCKAAHLIGATPHPEFGENNLLGPWFNYEGVNLKCCRAIVQLLGVRKDSIKIRVSGLYLIYAQVTYLLSPKTSINFSAIGNSYTVELVSGTDITILTRCFHSESRDYGETSCYTATVYNLHAGDHLYIKQHELNRRIPMHPETTFFGVFLLHKERNNYLKKPLKLSKS